MENSNNVCDSMPINYNNLLQIISSLKQLDNVVIKLEENGNCVILDIEDDGKGFLIRNLKNQSGSVLMQNGIENMRTRAKLLSGDLALTSDPERGTKLVVTICPEEIQIL